MLSLHDGTENICIRCFEKNNVDPKSLDSHDHDPYSPGKFIPYHPFTKRYATSHGFLQSDCSSWSGSGSDEEEAAVKKKAKKKAPRKQTKKNVKNTKASAVKNKKATVKKKAPTKQTKTNVKDGGAVSKDGTPGNHTR